MTEILEPQKFMVAGYCKQLNWNNDEVDVCDGVEERIGVVRLRNFVERLLVR